MREGNLLQLQGSGRPRAHSAERPHLHIHILRPKRTVLAAWQNRMHSLNGGDDHAGRESCQYASPARLLVRKDWARTGSPLRRLLSATTLAARFIREKSHRVLCLLRPSHRQPPVTELDEYGFPRMWRRDPASDKSHKRQFRRSVEHWPIFERWCQEHGLRAFPASEETLLRFLLFPPVTGRELYETWWAVSFRHDAYYWVSDADPLYLLQYGNGVYVSQDGLVTVPDDIQLWEGMSDQLLSDLDRYRRLR